MGASRSPPFCPECGLFHPCTTCGGGGKPKLAAVQPGWSRSEVLAAMRRAFSAGLGVTVRAATSKGPDLGEAEITALLEDLVP